MLSLEHTLTFTHILQDLWLVKPSAGSRQQVLVGQKDPVKKKKKKMSSKINPAPQLKSSFFFFF